jgi:hypothetical protein
MSGVWRVVGTIFLFCPILSGQFRAGVQGVVKDSSGGTVAGADVTLTNNETQRSQKAQTSAEGFYSFSGLPPGTYTISAQKQGFQRQSLNNVQVHAEDLQGQNMTLVPGDVSQTVTVTESSNPALQTENADVSKSITNEEVQRLPQYARDPYDLLRITPGVFADAARGGGGGAANLPNVTGPGGSIYSIFQTENQVSAASAGQRVSENNFEIDGVSANSLGWGGAAVVTPNEESVKEIHVSSDSYSAESGRNAGAQINVVSQNGSNQLHGSGFFKYDDPNFNAYNKYGGYDLPPTRVDQLYRQFGMSIGGPIIKNKLFYFFSYEGLRNSSVNYVNQWVETPSFRQAVIAARPGSIAAQILSDPREIPRVVSYANVPCPSGFAAGTCQQVQGGLDIGSVGGTKGSYVSATGGGLDGIADIQYAQLASPSNINANQYNGRVDYIHGNDTVALSMYFTHLDQIAADDPGRDRPIGDLPFTPLNTAATVTYNHVFSPTILNEARANLTRFASNQLAAAANANFQIPRIEIESLPFDRIRWGAPQGDTTPSIQAQNTYEFRDILSWVRGNNVMKFGGEVRKEQDNSDLLGGARPLYSFTGMWNFANDAPVFEQINANPLTGAPADAQRYFRTSTYSLFMQDDWKVTPQLTFNFGLRWEYFTPLREKYNDLSNLVLGSQYLLNAQVVPVTELSRPDRNNFAPRFGFAYNPNAFGKKLVWRGGFGVYFNRIYDALLANVRGNPPNFARYGECCGTASTPFDKGQIQYELGTTNSPLSYPANPALAVGINPANGAPNLPAGSGGVEIYGAPSNLPNGYAYIYSMELQYQLPSQMVLTVGYQGSADRKLTRLVNQNFLYPNNPAFSAVYFVTPDVNSNYNALLVTLTRRMANGLQVSMNYRYSESIDELSFGGPGAVTNQTYPQNNYLERGRSDFDVPQNFILSALYDLPIFRHASNWMGRFLGGWQINTVIQAHSGLPWTPVSGEPVDTPGGPTLSPSRPIAYYGGAGHDTSVDAYVNGTNFPLGGTAYFDIATTGPPGIGRNTWRGPRYFATDFSLVKSTKLPNRVLGEATNIDLRCNMFNAFNNLNLSPITFGDNAAHIDNAQFGRADAGLAGRVVEFQVRLSF